MSDATHHHTRWQCPICECLLSAHLTFAGHVALHALETVVNADDHRGECWECAPCFLVFETESAYNDHAAECDHAEVTHDG